ncbi:MAG: site-2 protease family protein, partial [Planctomycetota bacterium]
MSDIPYYLALAVAIALVIYSIILHEIAHAYAAFRLGDPTAAMRGRLTLNPVKHIDPFGTILFPLMTYYALRIIFGGAKPVPINPYNFRNPRKGMMISSIAGPLTNIAIALLFAGLHRLLLLAEGYVSDLFLFIAFKVGFLNTVLVVFNLLPIPPLDGSRVVSYFLPRNLRESYDKLERFGLFLVLAVVLLFPRQLSALIQYAVNAF